MWLLVGLSFAYGIFHAAGPGHGKAVISSYMLANEVALRRGILLSFVSAFLQALTAIVLMALVFLVLRGTAISMTDATWFLEIASYALITAFGAWLLWQEGRAALVVGARARGASRSPRAFAAARIRPMSHARIAAMARPCSRMTRHAPCARRSHPSRSSAARSARPAATAMRPTRRCCRATASSWRTAWSAVAAVGLRPCSGALIVLTSRS